jgi:formate dehydrogenase iron-sulfur subunit
MKVYVPRDASARAVGADAVAEAVRREAEARGLPLDLVRNGSRGMAWLEPLVEIETASGRTSFGPLAPEDVPALFADITRHPKALGPVEDLPWFAAQTRLTFARVGLTDPLSLADYEANGGLQGLRAALALSGEAIIDAMKVSGLRGRGGAGFPTGIKWDTVRLAPAPQKYIVCNADEGDSGTFADRMVMEGDPFVLLEGMAIAGLCVGATKGFVYIRSEYPDAIEVMSEAVRVARLNGLLGPSLLSSGPAFDVEIRVGAGAYVCGEETSLLNSLEASAARCARSPRCPRSRGSSAAPPSSTTSSASPPSPGSWPTGPRPTATWASAARAGPSPSRSPATCATAGCSRRLRHDARRDRRARGRHPHGAPRQGRAGRRPLGRLLPVEKFGTPFGYEEFDGQGGPDRPCRHRRLRRQRRHARAGPLRHGVLRGRILRQVHALPPGRRPRGRDDRPHPGRAIPRRCRCWPTCATRCATDRFAPWAGSPPIPVMSAVRHFPDDFARSREAAE